MFFPCSPTVFGVVHEVAIAQVKDHPDLREQQRSASSLPGAASGRASCCHWGIGCVGLRLPATYDQICDQDAMSGDDCGRKG